MAWTTPHTYVAGETLTAATLNADIRDNHNAAFPVGSIHHFMQSATTVETLINGFALEMNGVTVSRSTYANLNALVAGLGYPFGSGDGSTTFGLPDAAGRNLVAMAASGHSDVNALGKTDGLTKASRTPQHKTSGTSGTTGAGSAHSHGAGTLSNPHKGPDTTVTSTSTGSGMAVGNFTPPVAETITGSTATESAHTHTYAFASLGPSGTRPSDTVPFIVPGVYAVKAS